MPCAAATTQPRGSGGRGKGPTGRSLGGEPACMTRTTWRCPPQSQNGIVPRSAPSGRCVSVPQRWQTSSTTCGMKSPTRCASTETAGRGGGGRLLCLASRLPSRLLTGAHQLVEAPLVLCFAVACERTHCLRDASAGPLCPSGHASLPSVDAYDRCRTRGLCASPMSHWHAARRRLRPRRSSSRRANDRFLESACASPPC
jgi:hypothetical protein